MEIAPVERRDTLGFQTGPVPFVTERQFDFLTYALGKGEDAAITALDIDPAEYVAWMQDADFVALYDICRTNRREGFKLLATALLPKALRTISSMLDDPSGKVQQAGVNLLLRAQGLLVDGSKLQQKDMVEELFDALRRQQPVQVIEIKPRE